MPTERASRQSNLQTEVEMEKKNGRVGTVCSPGDDLPNHADWLMQRIPKVWTCIMLASQSHTIRRVPSSTRTNTTLPFKQHLTVDRDRFAVDLVGPPGKVS